MQQLLRAAKEIQVDETIIAGRRKNSLAQEQQWFKALEKERKINVCELGERKRKGRAGGKEWLYLKIGIFVIVQFITIVLVALLIK